MCSFHLSVNNVSEDYQKDLDHLLMSLVHSSSSATDHTRMSDRQPPFTKEEMNTKQHKVIFDPTVASKNSTKDSSVQAKQSRNNDTLLQISI